MAVAMRADGIDVRAVTAWSLFGSHSWNTLLTTKGVYEPGVYDTVTGTARATALKTLWKGFPSNAPRHPVVAEPGWWRRPDRLSYQPLGYPSPAQRTAAPGSEAALVICGATGTLGQAFSRACVARGIRHIVTDRRMLDLDRPAALLDTLRPLRPWGVVNAAGWVRVDDAELDEDACYRANATGAIALAQACAALGIPALNFSSDLVFDGTQAHPYVETDRPAPLNAYGRSKAAMEAGCAEFATSLVVRTAAFFAGEDDHNFAVAVLDAMSRGQPFDAADDSVVTPTYVPALVDAALDLLIDQEVGLWHLSNDEALSWADFARRVAIAGGYDLGLIQGVPGASLGWRAQRPVYAALGSVRGASLGPIDRCIRRVVEERHSRHSDRRVA